MSVKAKIAAGAATLALAGGGLGMVGTLSASAATPSCGPNCDNWYTKKFHSAYVLDVLHGQASTGNEVILFQASSSDPAEDFLAQDLGTVDSYNSHHRHLISAGLDRAYGGDDVIEIRYEPLGRKSNFCIGTWPGEAAQAGLQDPPGELSPGRLPLHQGRGGQKRRLHPADHRHRHQLPRPTGAELPGRAGRPTCRARG